MSTSFINRHIMHCRLWNIGCLACLLLLQGCGFHLRRESFSSMIAAHLPEILLKNKEEYSPFIRVLMKQLHDCGVRIQEVDAFKNDTELPWVTVQKIRFYETVVAFPAHGRGVEYEYGGIFELTFRNETQREHLITVQVVRHGFEKVDSNPLIKEAQQDEFRRAIEEEAATQVVKRIYWIQKLK